MKDLIRQYNKKRSRLKKRIRDFEKIGKGRDKDIFPELCFCLLTPQSKALSCDKAIQELKRSGLLFSGCQSAVKNKLKGVRFHNNKARYIVAARDLFSRIGIKKSLDLSDPRKARQWLVDNIKGLGYKEASHFLRNIGLGKDIAILDRHILRNLKKYKVIRQVPATLSRKKYLDIEDKMRKFSRQLGIPLDELDLLFWSNETGVIFK